MLNCVFRYDALTINNKVSYQNALNSSNFPFAKDAGNMLTNYCWKEADAKSSTSLASCHLENLYFGIDVWAQNTTKLTHPRVTYPEKGGGGTNTGMAVAKLVDLGLSAGVFAPAWSFEHFPGYGRAVERAMWEGTQLPDKVDCSCGDCRTRHQPNTESPIIKFARENPAGSDKFFFTDFSRAFSKHQYEEQEIFGGHEIHAQLGAQSILPHPLKLRDDNQAVHLSYSFEDVGKRTQLVVESKLDSSAAVDAKDADSECWLTLYKLDIPADGSLNFRVAYRNLLPSTTGAVVSFYFKYTDGPQFLSIPGYGGIQSLESSIGMAEHPSRWLQELGIHIRGSPTTKRETIRLVEIMEICISPQSTLQAPKSCILENIRIEHRSNGENKHVRLCWNYELTKDFERIDGIPYSDITGPFSYFSIQFDGLRLGRSYASEYPLPLNIVERYREKEVEIQICGIGFNGQILAECHVKLDL